MLTLDMPHANHNLAMLTFIARKLGDLCTEVTFVGGCTTALLITDYASADVRMTTDVDCVVDVLSLKDFYSIEKKLIAKNFKQSTHSPNPICRWELGGPINENH